MLMNVLRPHNSTLEDLLANLDHSHWTWRPLDWAFAKFIGAQEPKHETTITILAAMLSAKLGQQDTCLDLNELQPKDWALLQVSDVVQLKSLLQEANTVVQADPMGHTSAANKPIVLWQDRVFLQRYWNYERMLADWIQSRIGHLLSLNVESVKQVLDQLFDVAIKDEVDWQKAAVAMAISLPFSIITGGPGTGKTTTVAKLLALLDSQKGSMSRPLKIELVAPTGKAAARLSESITAARHRLPSQFQGVLDVQCTTIHRLLGTVSQRVDFRHNGQRKLHLDVLIVDEASMVDLPLMYKLLSAVPEQARVVLLGDQNQLSSVEAGSVLSDICAAAQWPQNQSGYSQTMAQRITQLTGQRMVTPNENVKDPCIQDLVTRLEKSHRFDAGSGIGKLSVAVISGQYEQVIDLLQHQNGEDLVWSEQPSHGNLVTEYCQLLKGYFAAIERSDVALAFSQFEQLQVLCATRTGEWGTEYLNQQIEQELQRQGYIDKQRIDYAGRPIMLAQNDHSLKLYNGDIGIVMADPQQPEIIKAWFRHTDGQMRGVLISRLPAHDTVYAMTIHKSQGSEFDQVYLCMPDPKHAASYRGLSRELLYTGLTRAKKKIVLFCALGTLQRSLSTGCQRSSALALRLSTKQI